MHFRTKYQQWLKCTFRLSILQLASLFFTLLHLRHRFLCVPSFPYRPPSLTVPSSARTRMAWSSSLHPITTPSIFSWCLLWGPSQLVSEKPSEVLHLVLHSISLLPLVSLQRLLLLVSRHAVVFLSPVVMVMCPFSPTRELRDCQTRRASPPH